MEYKKEIKVCQNEGCFNTFKPFKSTDKFCSYLCAKANAKPSKPRKQINPVSKKKQALDRLYTILRKKFLQDPNNLICPIKKTPTTEIHHKAGRVGELYLNTKYWLAVSADGHKWIHANPAKAYKKGYLIKSTLISL